MIRLLLLGAAVLAGGVVLKAAHDKPGPLTVDGALQAVRPGAAAATRAVDSAGELAGTISRAADTGWTAAKDTAGMVGDAVDAGSKLVGIQVPKLGDIGARTDSPPKARTSPPSKGPGRVEAAPAAPPAASYRAPGSRSSAMAILPMEQAVPEAADAAPAGSSQGDR